MKFEQLSDEPPKFYVLYAEASTSTIKDFKTSKELNEWIVENTLKNGLDFEIEAIFLGLPYWVNPTIKGCKGIAFETMKLNNFDER